MRQKTSPILLFAGCLALAGCATSVQFQTLHGPALDLNGARKIKIGKFSTQGRPSAPMHGLIDLFGDVVASTLDKSRDAKRDAWIREDLVRQLSGTGRLELVDEDTFDLALEGSYSFDLSDNGPNSNGSDEISIVRTATTKILYAVTTKSGRILSTDSVRGSAQVNGTGKTTSDVTIYLAGWNEEILRQSIGSANSALSHAFAPYRTMESRLLGTGDDKSIKAANKLAAKGRWEEAVALWKRASNGSPKDRIASLRNLAIYHESRGELDSALALYEQAQVLDPSESSFAQIRQTKRWIQDSRRLGKEDSLRLAPKHQEDR